MVLDERLCQEGPGEVRTRGQDVSYWCPLTMFLEESNLIDKGRGLIVKDFAANLNAYLIRDITITQKKIQVFF